MSHLKVLDTGNYPASVLVSSIITLCENKSYGLMRHVESNTVGDNTQRLLLIFYLF